MSEICTQRIPELDQRLSDAIAALGPWSESSGREPASMTLEGAPQPLSQADREPWESWAQARLFETQHYIDMAGEMPAVRSELTEIANALVTFHGYAQSGRGGRMMYTLQGIQSHTVKVKGQLCTN